MDFGPLPFRPLPLLGNPHVQTVLGNLLAGARRGCRRRPTRSRFPTATASSCTTRRRPAGAVTGRWRCSSTAWAAATSRATCSAWPIVSRRPACVFTAWTCAAAGRGSAWRNGITTQTARPTSAPSSRTCKAPPGGAAVLAGFSLGGGIVLKMTGEAASAPLANLCAVAAVAPPLDLLRCSDLIGRLPLYDAFYVRHLTAQVYRHQRLHPDVTPIRFPRRLTLREFDEIYTAPRWGFADAADYYARASALPWVAKIGVPTLVLTAPRRPVRGRRIVRVARPEPARSGPRRGRRRPPRLSRPRRGRRRPLGRAPRRRLAAFRARTVADRPSAGHNGRTSPVPTHDPRLP